MKISFTRKILLVILIASAFFGKVFTQSGLLNREDLLPVVNDALAKTYNFEFEEAKNNLELINKSLPDHPASLFLEALIIFWENYPMTLDNPNAQTFIDLMEKSAEKGEKMARENKNNPEGIFFALFSRAFYAMFFSDNGKASKVFPYLNSMYDQMLKGMKMKDKFVEFYFSSGLYNYYIEAYPENHPVYRPVKLLFKSGDKKQGLRELEHCADEAIYLRVEAKYFLSFIYLGYENNSRLATEYAGELHREFPDNNAFSGLYAETLLFAGKYNQAEVVINSLSRKTDDYSRMQTHVLRGYLLEKHEKDYDAALNEYQKGLELALKYGPQATHLQVLAWMGMSRYYKIMENSSESVRYFKMAKNETSYEYILNDR